MDYRLALMCGIDLPMDKLPLILHQPKIKEIAYIGEEDFFIGAQVLCANKNMFIEDKTLLSNVTNFQIFMTIMSQKEAADKKKSTMKVLSLLFPKHKIILTPRSLILTPENNDPITIDDNNYEDLQMLFKLIFCVKEGPMDTQALNPSSDKAREIAQKIMRGRQRVAAQKGDNITSVLSQYTSILTIGLNSMSLQQLQDLTMFQLYDLVERYSLYTNWDLDIRSRLAGGKPDSQPDNWMKNIH